MTPISLGYPDHEVIYAKDQPEYIPLPAYKWKDGTVVTKWQLTWKERFLILFNGHFFFSILTFNNPLQPIRPSCYMPDEIRKNPYERG